MDCDRYIIIPIPNSRDRTINSNSTTLHAVCSCQLPVLHLTSIHSILDRILFKNINKKKLKIILKNFSSGDRVIPEVSSSTTPFKVSMAPLKENLASTFSVMLPPAAI